MTDMLLTEDNEIDLTRGAASLVRGIGGTAQRLRLRLGAVQGDWFLDLRFGLPYFQRIFRKNINEDDIYQMYYDTAVRTPGVASVDTLALEFNRPERTLNVSGSATFNEDAQPQSFQVEIT